MPFFSRRAVAEINGRLDYLCQHIYALERRSITIEQQGNTIMATLQDIQAAVAAEKTVEDSVLVLLSNIEQQLKDAIASNDPAAMQAVVDQINAQKQTMADAVAAGTPAAPAP